MDEPDDTPATPDPQQEWTRRTILLGRALVVGAVVMTVVALVLVQRTARTYEDGLTVAQDSAVLVSDAVVPVAALAADLGDLAATLAEGLDGARTVIGTSEQVLDDVGLAAATNLAETATAAADIADRLAAVFEGIERFIPGNSQSIAEELRSFSDGLEPLADQLVSLGEQLQTGAAELESTDAGIAALVDRVDAVATAIAELEPTFDALEVTATDLHDRAEDASTRLGLDLWLLRILVVLGGAVVAILGIVVERFARELSSMRPVRSAD